MVEQENLIRAKAAYEALCKCLDNNGWSYDKDDESFAIQCSAKGDDLPMPITVKVYPDRQVVVLISHMPFDIPEDKRIDIAVALCRVNNRVVDGSFDYDITDGTLYFRLTSSFVKSEINEETFNYMIYCSCSTIDEYNEKFLMLAKDLITLEQFLESMES